MKIFSDKRIAWVCLLLFCQIGATIGTAGYVNFGLLGSYSVDILPYYYAASGLGSACVILGSQFLVRRFPRGYVYILCLTSAFVTVLFFAFTQLELRGAVFAACVVLQAMADVVAIAIGNFIFLLFDIRELRRVSKIILIASGASALIFSVALPLIINSFGGGFLVLSASILYLGCSIASAQLKPIEVIHSVKKEKQVKPLSFPVFRLSILLTLFLSIAILLFDYAFKMSLKESFSKDMIGTISAAFSGIVSIVTILVLALENQILTKRFGPLNVLLFYPLIMLLFCALIMIVPGFISVVILVAIIPIYAEGISYTGVQVLINSIPRHSQYLARTQKFIIALFLSDVLITPVILLFLGEENSSIRVVVSIATVFAFFAVFVLWRIKKVLPEMVRGFVEQPRLLSFRDLIPSETINTRDIKEILPRIGHRFSVKDALFFLRSLDIDPIPDLIADIEKSKDVPNFQARIRVLGQLPSAKVEVTLAQLMETRLAILPNGIAKTVALRAMSGIGDPFRQVIAGRLADEGKLVSELRGALKRDATDFFMAELNSRLELAILRFYYYFAALGNTRAVLNALPRILDATITKSEQVKKADALDYLDMITKDLSLRRLLNEVADPKNDSITELQFDDLISRDSWLVRIKPIVKITPGANMDTTKKALFLRRVKLFESLPVELLEFISESMQEEVFDADKVIFSMGDEGDKAYMVVSGDIGIERDGKILAQIPQYGIFGEIGLLGEAHRVATAIAKTNTVLLTIQKQEFLQMVEDVPEISKAVINQLLGYLHVNAKV